MAEDLTPADVEEYTDGRLPQGANGTQRALNAALARVRNYCGWHVSPVRSETIVKNGTNDRWLSLPTLKIVEVTEVTECGVVLDLSTIKQSADEPGFLVKQCGHWRYGLSNIEVELSHGFTADEAADFREAVLGLIDTASLSIGSSNGGPVIFERVDDVETHWSALPSAIENTPMDKSTLARYRILPFA
ncbi:hypothetical protein FHT44_005121 [Mycolicibacterium sp. BK634]|uniref:hypothetical protein n=1 Tax=Mycolicibacterium sp. BK634 TaxID=2587099 RepID=UPI001620E9DB|nr:hypothetical protein [Mycolicibacterium sp. BK634]MBB3752609.1 hypothetical protein [Mycolicibacterium sp. BK634]